MNFDTGNSFLAGNDPVDCLRGVAESVIHVHIKDIPASQLSKRGKVTGTRVGVAAGDGVVDLPGVVGVLAAAGYKGSSRLNVIRSIRLAGACPTCGGCSPNTNDDLRAGERIGYGPAARSS